MDSYSTTISALPDFVTTAIIGLESCGTAISAQPNFAWMLIESQATVVPNSMYVYTSVYFDFS